MNADPEMQEKTKHVKYEEGVEWMKTYLSVTKTFQFSLNMINSEKHFVYIVEHVDQINKQLIKIKEDKKVAEENNRQAREELNTMTNQLNLTQQSNSKIRENLARMNL